MTYFRSIFCFLAALAAACLTAACRSPQDILLTESDSGRTLDLCVGDTILVALNVNRSTGFDWYPRHGAGDVQILAEKGDRYVYDPDPVDVRKHAVGQEGSHYFAYRVIGPGICGIALEYKRSWEKKDPAKLFEVMIRATGTPEEAATDPREMPPDEQPVYMTDSKGNVTVRPDSP